MALSRSSSCSRDVPSRDDEVRTALVRVATLGRPHECLADEVQDLPAGWASHALLVGLEGHSDASAAQLDEVCLELCAPPGAIGGSTGIPSGEEVTESEATSVVFLHGAEWPLQRDTCEATATVGLASECRMAGFAFDPQRGYSVVSWSSVPHHVAQAVAEALLQQREEPCSLPYRLTTRWPTATRCYFEQLQNAVEAAVPGLSFGDALLAAFEKHGLVASALESPSC